MTDGEVVVLGRSGVRTAYVLLLAGVVATVALAVLGVGVSVFYAAAFTGATAWQLFVRGADQVRLEADALVVRTRRRETRWAWPDVLEVAWQRQASFLLGPGPVLRVKGGPYDEPGPNLPSQVASLPIFGRQASVAAEEALREVVVRRGVRFDPHMLRDIALGRRSPQDPERSGGA